MIDNLISLEVKKLLEKHQAIEKRMGLSSITAIGKIFAQQQELQKRVELGSGISEFIAQQQELQKRMKLNLGITLSKSIAQQQELRKKLELLHTQIFSAHKNSIQPLKATYLTQMQSLVDKLEPDNNKEQAIESISQATNELDKNGRVSFDTIIKLIALLVALLAAYPSIKEIYKDITADPIFDICGILDSLEREAVKFLEVNHRAGTPLYKYPKGKKEVHSLMEGSQVCVLSEPKGNAKRIKVVYQSENGTQIYGYVDRSKLKRLYKN